jgi:purine-nucleoside phosphorylase
VIIVSICIGISLINNFLCYKCILAQLIYAKMVSKYFLIKGINMSLPTPHIEAITKDEFAKTVIMPGDPLRAKYIAENYLENVTKINNVRNMFAYTGTYKGHKVSVMGSGMGMPSMGIYSYELFKDYDVDNIIRVGSCGSYDADYKVYDVVLIEETYGESDFIEIVTGEKTKVIKPSLELNIEIEKSAKQQNVELKKAKAHCSDVFYRKNFDDYKAISKKYDCQIVEMETAALFANAKALGKNAAAVMTVSDCLVTGESTTSAERQDSFTNMMEVALGTLENS